MNDSPEGWNSAWPKEPINRDVCTSDAKYVIQLNDYLIIGKKYLELFLARFKLLYQVFGYSFRDVEHFSSVAMQQTQIRKTIVCVLSYYIITIRRGQASSAGAADFSVV